MVIEVGDTWHALRRPIILISHLVKSDNDPYILMAEEGLRTLVEATTPGSWIVEFVPWRELHF